MYPNSLPGDRERLKRFYETSHDYKKLLDAHDRAYLQSYVDTVNKYAGPASRILDMGCGNGFSAYMLSESGHWVIGSDISTFFLSDSAHLQNDRLRYQACDALDLPYADGSFDVVCSTELIEHVTDAPRTLLGMIRVLKEGGILVITGPNLCSPIWGARDFISMIRGKSGRDLWSETKMQALKWGCGNLAISLKKWFSSQVEFIYRKPDMERASSGGDSDSAYYASPIDLERFLKAHGMRIVKLYEPVSLRGRIVATLMPRFSPAINMVAQKGGTS